MRKQDPTAPLLHDILAGRKRAEHRGTDAHGNNVWFNPLEAMHHNMQDAPGEALYKVMDLVEFAGLQAYAWDARNDDLEMVEADMAGSDLPNILAQYAQRGREILAGFTQVDPKREARYSSLNPFYFNTLADRLATVDSKELRSFAQQLCAPAPLYIFESKMGKDTRKAKPGQKVVPMTDMPYYPKSGRVDDAYATAIATKLRGFSQEYDAFEPEPATESQEPDNPQLELF